MAVKDHTKYYDGLREVGSITPTPNTVSRNNGVGDRSFQTVIWQSGKAVLDSDLQCGQDAAWWDTFLFRKWQGPSGWLRGTTQYPALDDYTVVSAPATVTDDTPLGLSILADRTLIDSFLFPRLECLVAGRPVVVEYTNTRTSGWNLIQLDAPQIYDGTPNTVKRTDFVFLEVWQALVAPSPVASGWVQIDDSTAMVPGDLVTIAGIPLTAALVPGGVDTFVLVPGNEVATATNLATAINDPLNSISVAGIPILATDTGDLVVIECTLPGAGAAAPPPPSGNFISLSVTTAVPGAMVASGAMLTGGADRPSKPATAQDYIYRHGNVLSPASVWLQDEIVDPTLKVETTQRVQLQYRIRATDSLHGVDYKKHPDGFSNIVAAPGPTPTIYAQGGAGTPVTNYPFVPADQNSLWQSSSAVAYGIEDPGLWIAGDGTKTAAKALGSLDGFVYAIPICFIHRHNDSSDAGAFLQGFDPVSNANGAPCYQHAGFNGPLGAIPAGASDRPDGEYADVINVSRILDLRRHVLLTGIDSSKEVQYQIQSLLDGQNLTWSVDTTDKQFLGGNTGDVSTRHLICNEIGRNAANGGNNVTSGTTQRGVQIRDFDHVARRFGDQSVVERLVIAFYPGDRAIAPSFAPGLVNLGKYVTKAGATPDTEWAEDDVLHLDLSEFDATTLGGIFQGLDGGGTSYVPGWTPSVSRFAPPGTVITDVLSIYHDDGLYAAPVSQVSQIKNTVGLGTSHVAITLDANPTLASNGLPIGGLNPVHTMIYESGLGVGSARRIFLEVEVTYPLGVGATDNPDLEVIPDVLVYDNTKSVGDSPGPGPIIENDAAQRASDYEGLISPHFRENYREIQLEYVTNDTTAHGPTNAGSPVGSITLETIVSRNRREVYPPRRIFGSNSKLPSLVDVASGGAMTTDNSLTEYGSSSRKWVVDANLSGAGQTLCEIEYFPQDPLPNYGPAGGGYQVAVYYRSNSPQTAGVKDGNILSTVDGVLPTVLNIEPLAMGPSLWTGQIGSGSQDQSYPYGQPLDQIPMNDNLGDTTKEWFFCATANIAVSDFSADTGLLSLHPFVNADAQNVFQFGGLAVGETPRVDAEFRAYYPFVADWVYQPTLLSQPLYGSVRHKVLFPFLGRIVEEVHAVDGNGILFRKNEVVLIVLSRFAELDGENTITFTDTDNTTCAGLYRTRNMLLVVGDTFRPVPTP